MFSFDVFVLDLMTKLAPITICKIFWQDFQTARDKIFRAEFLFCREIGYVVSKRQKNNFITRQWVGPDTWTPELLATLKNRRHWRTNLTKAQKLPNKIGIVASIAVYMEASAKFKEADREYKNLCKDTKDARKEFLKARAEYAAKLKITVAEKEIKSIIEVERQRNQSKQQSPTRRELLNLLQQE